MKFSIENGIRIAEVPAKDLRVILYDGKKKSMGVNRCNAGFFGNYKEQGELFTLPVGHLIADYEATNQWTEFYCLQRGGIYDGKVYHDANSHPNAFKGKRISTMVISGGRASILDLTSVPADYDYAISGIPIMRDGKDVKFATYVKGQGWNGSELYGTWHIFVGIKVKTASIVYVMAMKTTTPNMILSAEAFKRFHAMGFYDVIKLDGGGSFYFNADSTTQATAENRRVCTILDFGESYPVPTRTLRSGCKGDDVKWLQWELTSRGFTCGIDGRFGPTTKTQLMSYQEVNRLDVDGSCGPATRASLLKK